MKPVSRKHLAASLVLAVLACGCGESPVAVATPASRGQELFDSTALSPSQLNAFACITCHDARPPSAPSFKTGAALAGVTRRSSFWGGQENDLLESINACREQFMIANIPLKAADPDAEALFAYLQSLEPGEANPVAFTVVRTIEPLSRGDAATGEGLYAAACGTCHGAMHTGEGRLDTRHPILPDDTVREHADLSARVQRLVFTEKVRHGLFLDYGGDMPPFSLEVLSDAELSDVLEALGVLGE